MSTATIIHAFFITGGVIAPYYKRIFNCLFFDLKKIDKK